MCEVLKRELGLIILRELTFPTPLVTVSAVDITPDLKQAFVYVSALGNDAQRLEVITLLEQNRGTLQALVSKRVVHQAYASPEFQARRFDRARIARIEYSG